MRTLSIKWVRVKLDWLVDWSLLDGPLSLLVTSDGEISSVENFVQNIVIVSSWEYFKYIYFQNVSQFRKISYGEHFVVLKYFTFQKNEYRKEGFLIFINNFSLEERFIKEKFQKGTLRCFLNVFKLCCTNKWYFTMTNFEKKDCAQNINFSLSSKTYWKNSDQKLATIATIAICSCTTNAG